MDTATDHYNTVLKVSAGHSTIAIDVSSVEVLALPQLLLELKVKNR